MIRRALLIVNPASRRGTRDLPRVQAAFTAGGAECDTRLTPAPGDAAGIPLREGSNTITVKARDAAGNEGWRAIVVTRKKR